MRKLPSISGYDDHAHDGAMFLVYSIGSARIWVEPNHLTWGYLSPLPPPRTRIIFHTKVISDYLLSGQYNRSIFFMLYTKISRWKLRSQIIIFCTVCQHNLFYSRKLNGRSIGYIMSRVIYINTISGITLVLLLGLSCMLAEINIQCEKYMFSLSLACYDKYCYIMHNLP